MNQIDTRQQFIKKWYERGKNEQDQFDKFFSLWIALVAASSRWQNLFGLDEYDQTDKDKILKYLRGHEEQVSRLLIPGVEEIKQIAKRRGQKTHNPILDTWSRTSEASRQRARFQQFAEHYEGRIVINKGDLVDTLAEILNKIRNNVFHGAKIYDAQNDLDLLRLVNPVLAGLLLRCEANILN